MRRFRRDAPHGQLNGGACRYRGGPSRCLATSPGRRVVMGIGLVRAKAESVRDRLIQAADEELAACGTLTGRFEAVAHRAGVSRATAYRQLGSISELLTQVGVLRARRYLAGVQEVMDRETGALAKLEASIVYGARLLPDDPIVMRLIARQYTSGRDPEVYEIINGMVPADGRPRSALGRASQGCRRRGDHGLRRRAVLFRDPCTGQVRGCGEEAFSIVHRARGVAPGGRSA